MRSGISARHLAALLVPAAVLLLGAAAPRVATMLEDCDAMVRRAPGELGGYRCYWFVGRNHAQLPGAERRLEHHLEEDPSNVRARLMLGAVLVDLGSPRGEALLREAAEDSTAEADAEVEVLARLTLARVMRLGRRTSEAASELGLALRRAESHRDPELEARVRVDMAWQTYYERDYGTAWKLFRRAEDLVFPSGHVQEREDTLDGLAASSWALGRPEHALDYYRRELQLARDGDPIRTSDILRNMANAAESLEAQGRIGPGEFIRLCRDALDAAVRAGNRPAETSARLLLARGLEGEEAVREVRQALDLSLRLRRPAETSWALALLGRKLWALDPDQAGRARELMERSATVAAGHGDAEGLAQSLLSGASLARAMGDRTRAAPQSIAALDAVERIRDLQPDGELRARVFSRFAEDYRFVASYLLAGAAGPDDVEAAFRVTERMRARMLLDTLDAAGAVRSGAGPLFQERSRLLTEIRSVRHALSRPDLPEPDRARRLEELDRLEASERDTRARIARSDPSFAALRGDSIPPIVRLQDALEPDQALVSYVIPRSRPGADASAWAIVVTRDRARPVPLPDCARLESRVALYLSLLARADGSEQPGAAALHRCLVDPVLSVLPGSVSRLLVVPDGPAHRLAFRELAPAGGRPLAERYEMSLVPSGTTWLRWRTTEHRPHRGVLSLADPDPPPVPIAESGTGEIPGRLVHARAEATALHRRLGIGGAVLLGPDATPDALAGPEVTTCAVLHLAAHALVDEDRPEMSAVVLAPGRSGGSGLLRYAEITALPLDGQLVVLTACRSGSGPVIGGEGAMGLANAFFQAGARCVVAGLAPVRDRETAALVDDLASYLGRGHSVAAALALASRHAIRRGVPPACWAGLVVLGDGDLVPVPAPAPRHALVIAAALAGVVLLALFGTVALRLARR